RDVATIRAVVIRWLPDALRSAHAERRVVDHRCKRVFGLGVAMWLESGECLDRLECRARLTPCIHCAFELFLALVAATHHCEHVAVARFQRRQGYPGLCVVT